MFRNAGHSVIATHIDTGGDFWELEPFQCDYIISNPPYSMKVDIMERLFLYGIPFALLLSAPSLFDGVRRFGILKDAKFEIMVFDKRCAFTVGVDGYKVSPPHASLYLCSGILPQQIVFEELHRPGRKSKMG